MPDVIEKYGAKPFQEAVDFFKEKINMPSEKWDDLWKDQHAKGFMVAGAMKADLLMDLRGAVEKAITDGETLDAFRKRFDDIVAKRGWVYKGGRNWRTKVIYDTNLRQSYNAGRYKQMADPDVIALRPYVRYRHADYGLPKARAQHLAWDGLILRHDDPFWATHKPQNGWGCRCSIDTLSERDLKKLGKSGPDTAPKAEYYDYKNPKTGKMEKVPVGIDPGFDYDPGAVSHAINLDKYPEKLRAHMAEEFPGLGVKDKGAVPAPVPVKKAFVPASTIKEAEEWAIENLGIADDYKSNNMRFIPTSQKEKSGILNRNFVSGYDASVRPLDQLNSVNELINESNQVCDKLKIPRLRGITLDTHKGGALGDGSLQYGASMGLGKTKKIATASTWKPGDALSLRPEGAHQYFDNDHEQAVKTFWHEIGHHIHHQYGVSNRIEYNNPPLERMMVENKNNKAFIKKTSPSKYGAIKHSEWFAENFALYKMGRRDLLSKEAVGIFEELFK